MIFCGALVESVVISAADLLARICFGKMPKVRAFGNDRYGVGVVSSIVVGSLTLTVTFFQLSISGELISGVLISFRV